MQYYVKKGYLPPTRVVFNPTNQEHRLDYARFLKYNGWRDGCRFFLEEPYTDIPTMINAKIVEHALRPLMKSIA